MDKRPNVLFFLTDDQRFDTIAALGNKEIFTPNLDELVRNGTAFTQAHIPGGSVGAVCMPSRAMLNTGRTLYHIEKNGSNIPKEHALMGETFRKAGYCTFGTGKWHNGTSSYARSFTDGGEIFFSGMWDHWNVPVCNFDPTGEYANKSKVIVDHTHSNKVKYRNCDHIHFGKHSSELFCDFAAEWLEKYDKTEPFFMYVSLLAPHDPRSMPEKFQEMYDPERITLPDNFMEEHLFSFGMRGGRDENLAPYPRTPEVIRQHIADYYAMISHLDNEFGKVLEALKKSGKYENTIIVFAADNGLAVGQHGLMGKQNNYEHSIRVPLIFSGPGIPKNEEREAYVYLLDIFPTLCVLTGLEIPQSVEGRSFAKIIKDKKVEIRDSIYSAFAGLIRGVKDKRYKLIEYRNEDLKKTQMFDLLNDPSETNNLYGREDLAEKTQILKEMMLKYKEEWGDDLHPTGKIFWDQY